MRRGQVSNALLDEVGPEFVEFSGLPQHFSDVLIFFEHGLFDLLLGCLLRLTAALTFAFAHLCANPDEVANHEVREAHLIKVRWNDSGQATEVDYELFRHIL